MAMYGPKLQHKPNLVLASNGVVLSQWLDATYQNFPDLRIFLTHGEKPTDAKFSNCWVPAYAMRQAPADLRPWPEHLQNIFDVANLKSSRAIVLSTYDTFANRTVVTTMKLRTGRNNNKAVRC